MTNFLIGFLVGLILYHVWKPIVKPRIVEALKVNPSQVNYAEALPEPKSKRRSIKTKVVGVTFEGRQEVIGAFCRSGTDLTLVRNPENPHDRHAIEVWINQPPTQIGFLSRELAYKLREATNLDAWLLAVTGGGDQYLGVNIRVEYDA